MIATAMAGPVLLSTADAQVRPAANRGDLTLIIQETTTGPASDTGAERVVVNQVEYRLYFSGAHQRVEVHHERRRRRAIEVYRCDEHRRLAFDDVDGTIRASAWHPRPGLWAEDFFPYPSRWAMPRALVTGVGPEAPLPDVRPIVPGLTARRLKARLSPPDKTPPDDRTILIEGWYVDLPLQCAEPPRIVALDQVTRLGAPAHPQRDIVITYKLISASRAPIDPTWFDLNTEREWRHLVAGAGAWLGGLWQAVMTLVKPVIAYHD